MLEVTDRSTILSAWIKVFLIAFSDTPYSLASSRLLGAFD